jgi:hypothetical protein
MPVIAPNSESEESLRSQIQAYYQSLHDRAAATLTPAQLAAYDRLAKDRMGGVEYQIETMIAQRAQPPKSN